MILGLSVQEALDRLERFGPNLLPLGQPRGLFRIFKEVLREPMVFLLLAIGGIYLVLGDQNEAASLLAFLILIIAITVYQEHKTERALDALQDLSCPRALVIRNGKRMRIPGTQVVPDDIIVISEGDRISADALVISCSNLAVDESLLTGESVPVVKRTAGIASANNQDQLLSENQVYAGTTVVRGQGLARVIHTGMSTELGQIGKSLEKTQPDPTYLQRETRKLVKTLGILASILCVGVVIAFALTRHDWLGGVLSGLTLAMAILPNELPAVLLIFLTMGAWRLSLRRVLTRRIPAVETLGAATVLCVDKTGTLTLNRMAIQTLWKEEGIYPLSSAQRERLPDEFHELVEYGILASRPQPFDPMERAFHTTGLEYLRGTEHLHEDWVLLKEYPITESLLAVSYAWRPAKNKGLVVGAKGAPEAIIDLCHLNREKADRIKEAVSRIASEGLRVLAVAKASSDAQLPTKQHDFDFEFLGLIGLADPVRPDVPRAVAECRDAGIRVIMITGDHPETAKSVAKKIGLSSPEEMLTGLELAQLSEIELQKRLKKVSIFSRMIPEQKLRLVNALKAMGEVVAMTGDGVNDAPALKSADIGIAMGARGTDVAREAAALVLLEDDFSSIVTAVRMGRRVFSNLRNAFAYLLAVHVPITAISIIPVLFKLPLVLFPIHIAFLHLVIEPACSFVFETEIEDGNIMKMPPRNPKDPLFSWEIIQGSLIQGVWVTLVVLIVFLIALSRAQSDADARALTFTTLIIANLGLILSNRSWTEAAVASLRRTNRTFAWVSIGSVLLLGAVLYVPWLRELFQFSVLHPLDLFICVFAGALVVAGFDLSKRRRWLKGSARSSA